MKRVNQLAAGTRVRARRVRVAQVFVAQREQKSTRVLHAAATRHRQEPEGPGNDWAAR